MRYWRAAAAIGAAGAAGALGYLTLAARHDEHRIAQMWEALEKTEAVGTFDPAAVTGLPQAARRYLLRAVVPGAPLAASVELTIDGRLRSAPDNPWMEFTSREILHREMGFVWRASTAGMPVRGYDRYVDGAGEMRWRLFGLVPVVQAQDENVTRSAAERYAAERIFLPTSLSPGPGVEWLPDEADDARVAVDVDGRRILLTLTLTEEGDLAQVRLDRWGDRGAGSWRLEPYGVRCAEPRTFEGFRIPTRVEARWSPGNENELLYFEGRISSAQYR